MKIEGGETLLEVYNEWLKYPEPPLMVGVDIFSEKMGGPIMPDVRRVLGLRRVAQGFFSVILEGVETPIWLSDSVLTVCLGVPRQKAGEVDVFY